MSKVIRGLAITGVTTIEQHLKICKVCGDENNNMSQHDIDEEQVIDVDYEPVEDDDE